MKKKVIIHPIPQAQSGLEVKMQGLRAGLGFNANKMPWPVMAGKMSAPDLQVNSTLKPVPREDANLEAEKDEIAALPTKSGVPNTFKIGGQRHHSGGTPLNLPSDSFIFSDTAKMKIKDPTVLAQFGLPERSGGYTPADIAKKYDINSFKKILADPDTDKLQKQTAELMISNYNLKLAKLAIVQESMKGFPQGIPAIAMPYIEEMGIDPAQFVQMNPGGAQQEQADTQQTQMDDVGAEAQGRFGGYMRDGGYKTEAEYKAHLLDPYSPEKRQAQMDWNANKMFYTNPKNDEEKRKRLDYLQKSIGDIGFNPLEFYKRQQEAGQLFKDLGQSNPDLVKKEIQTGKDAGKLMIAAGKYIFPATAPLFNGVEGSMALGEFAQNPNMHNTASLATEVAPLINNKYGTAYQLMGDYLTGQEVGLLPADKKAYGGTPKYGNGGISPEQAKVMFDAAMKSGNPDVMAQVAKNIAATKSSKDKWYSGAWNPLADEWDFDKYEDLLLEKSTQLKDQAIRQKNYGDYKKKFYTEIYPHYSKLEEKFNKNPMANYSAEELDQLSKLNEVKSINRNLLGYEEAIQADKQHRAPKYPVSMDVLGSSFDPNLLNPYAPVKAAQIVAPVLPNTTTTDTTKVNPVNEARARLSQQNTSTTQPVTTDYEDVSDMNLTKAEIDKYKAAGEKFIINGVKYN